LLYLRLNKHMRILLFIAAFVVTLQASAQTKPQIKWLTWEQAMLENSKVKKKIFVDVYTDWCGWCKVMDSKTFSDSAVAAYMNKNFYCVKLNAEQREDIRHNGKALKYDEKAKVHQLAWQLLQGKMMYPSFAILSEKEEPLKVLKGFYERDMWLYNLGTVVDGN